MGKLELCFSLRNGRSVLTKYRHTGPVLVQRSFYSDYDEITPHIYLLHPSGGWVGGDLLKFSAQLNPESSVLFTTPGSSIFYRTNGKYVLQQYTFKLMKNTMLEWMPQSNIFFPQSKVKIENTFILEQGSRLILFEMLCFNVDYFNTVNIPEEVDISLRICFSNNDIGFRDRFKINSLNYMNKLAGFKISASLFAVPSDEMILKKIRTLMPCTENMQIGGATLLDKLLVVRLLGNDNQKLKIILHHVWSIIRPIIMGKKAVFPRIWFT